MVVYYYIIWYIYPMAYSLYRIGSYASKHIANIVAHLAYQRRSFHTGSCVYDLSIYYLHIYSLVLHKAHSNNLIDHRMC